MAAKTLYKYLDVDGGAAMLCNGNLMFTNATQLNDPFECHQMLVDYSKAPSEVVGPWDQKTIEELEVNRAERQRDSTWICSLSKVYNSLLMWTFYAKNHQGVCVGIDMDKANKYLDRIVGTFVGCPKFDVQYRDIAKKPDFFRDKEDYFTYRFATKAKDWEYEQEVRLITLNPSPINMKLMPWQNDEKGPIDWREIHAFADLGGECFDSLYMGISIVDYKREKLIEFAKKLNPEIKIYQMTIDPEAFRLKAEIIES